MNPSQDIFVLSTLLGCAISAHEGSVLPIERQCWEAVQRDLYEADTVVQFVKKARHAMLANYGNTLCDAYRHMLRMLGLRLFEAHAG